MRSLLVCLSILLAPVSAFSQNRSLQRPPALFSWISKAELTEWADSLPDGKIVFPTLPKRSWLVLAHPELEGLRGAFFWIDPVAGAADNGTLYGGLDDNQARLITLIPSRKARVHYLRTVLDRDLRRDKFPPPNPRVRSVIGKADFIFHQVYRADGHLAYQEWIALNANPEAVDLITARSELPRERIQSILPKLHDSNFQFEASDLHKVFGIRDDTDLAASFVNRQKFREEVLIPRLTAYLSRGDIDLPQVFSRLSCENIFKNCTTIEGCRKSDPPEKPVSH